MRYLTHDGSFAGILSCIYYAYENQIEESQITTEDVVFPTLFTLPDFIATDFVEAKKVAKRIIELVGYRRFLDLWKLSLVDDPKIGNKIFELIRFIQLQKGIMLYDYSHPAIKNWIKELKEVKQNLSFAKQEINATIDQDEMNISYVEPNIDIISLLYSDQEFLNQHCNAIVFDTKREYGLLIKNHRPTLIDASQIEMASNFDTVSPIKFSTIAQEKLWIFHLENYKPNRLLRNRKVVKAS